MLTIYKASAGSGKTFNLAYEYIKLLLGYKGEDGHYHLHKDGRFHHRAILAITFTNKATEEMKQRIVRELAILAQSPSTQGEKSNYASMLVREFGCTPQQLTAAANTALNDLLNDFTFFNVSTIDAFFQTVLRTFAREAELTGNYDVELSDDYAFATSIDTLLGDIILHDSLPDTTTGLSQDDREEAQRIRRVTHWVTLYMKNQLRNGKAFNLFNRSSSIHDNLVALIQRLSDETFKRHESEMLEYFADPTRVVKLNEALSSRLKAILDECKSTCSRLISLLDAHQLMENYISKNILGTVITLANGKLPASEKFNVSTRNAIGNPDQAYLKNAKTKLGSHPDIDAALRDALTAMSRFDQDYLTLKVSMANLFQLGLMADVYRNISQFRTDNNLILLSDTNQLLRRIISTDEAPFIYERLGMRLRHFLIDEFQDTSQMQWDNLCPLLEESLSHDHDNLIIGDTKQSIYRFRGGTPELLQRQVALTFPESTVERSGDTNWRSARQIVEFNNAFFSSLAPKLGSTEIYATVAQKVSPRHVDDHGEVRLLPFDTTEVDDTKEFSLQAMTAEIRRWIATGHRPSDIVVLVRRNSEAEDAINYLTHSPHAEGIPVLSDEALHIQSSLSVKLILSVLRVIAHQQSVLPGDHRESTKRAGEIVRFQSLYEYYTFHGAERAEAIGRAALSDPADVARLESLATEAADLECTSPISVVDRIINRYIPTDIRRRDAPFIDAFCDTVVDYSSRFGASVPGFLKWWDITGYKASIPAPASVDAVRVMTIHKSKGLEFKCVVIPFTSWALEETKGVSWYESQPIEGIPDELLPPLIPLANTKKLESTIYASEFCHVVVSDSILDALNNTYVAFTRAEQALSIIYPTNLGNSSFSIGEAISLTLPSIDEHLVHIVNPADEIKDMEAGLFPLPRNDKDTKDEDKAYTDEDSRPINDVIDHIYDNDHLWEDIRIDDLPDPSRPRDRGIMIHDILAQVTTADTLDRAIRRSAHRGLLPRSEVEIVSRTLHNLVEGPQTREWFAPTTRIMRERPIVTPDGDRYRPDRVVTLADGRTIVIDYKTGQPRKAHAAQVKQYAALLSHIFDAPVTPLLLYLPECRIVEA